MSPLITAVRTLTILRIPGRDTERFSSTFVFFPVVGALLAGLTYGVYLVGHLLFPGMEWLTALVMVLFLTLLTGALHLDGLADAADGFGGGNTKERILEIMKDPRQGTFGVAAVVFDLALKAGFYYALILKHNGILPVLCSVFLGRCCQPVFMAYLPYARAEGGTAQKFCGDAASRPGALTALGLALAGLAALVTLPQAAVYFFAAVYFMFLCGLYFRAKINGITGDCIGAMNEIVELAVLAAGVIMLTHYPES